jgi:hypothetical protein
VLIAALMATTTSSPAPAAEHATAPCRAAVARGLLPAWARGGFSESKPRIAHVLGRSRAILAILFGNPLASPPATDHNNKILWVARKEFAFGDLRIRARQMRGTTAMGEPVERRVPGGPGPSIIDLPAAGCWRLMLTWKGGADTLDLRYTKPPRA